MAVVVIELLQSTWTMSSDVGASKSVIGESEKLIREKLLSSLM